MNTAPYVRGMPNQPWQPDRPGIKDVLREAENEEAAILAGGSNYVFLLKLRHPDAGEGYAVYKPERGEAPLSDFPDGTLYQREYAAYLVSEALGWGLIPPTIIREDGLDMSVGMLQLFIQHDPSQHYFTLKDERSADMRRIAVYDWLTNNADRKGGHCLLAADGRIWCIDQGLTFHSDEKLRTVIWEFQGQPVQEELLRDVRAFAEQLESDSDVALQLRELITPYEFDRLRQRAALIERVGVYPPPPAYRPYPWPMV